MKAIVNYKYIDTRFSHSDNGGESYDGHLTIRFRYGAYGKDGSNPLAHKQLGQMVKEIEPILIEKGLSKGSVVNCGWGEWKDVTFQYVKKENCQQIFDEVVKLFTELTEK